MVALVVDHVGRRRHQHCYRRLYIPVVYTRDVALERAGRFLLVGIKETDEYRRHSSVVEVIMLRTVGRSG